MCGSACVGGVDALGDGGSTEYTRYVDWRDLLFDYHQVSAQTQGLYTACVAGVDEGCAGPPVPEGSIDPNTGGPVCGPLSGECYGKPFWAPGVLNSCVSASGMIDVPGWLSYIACLMTNLPQAVWNVAVGAVNVLIDLVWPSNIGQTIELFRADIGGREPFVWIGSTVASITSAMEDPGGEDVLAVSGDLTGSVPVHFELGTAIQTLAVTVLAPWRGYMLVVMQLAFLFWLLVIIRDFVRGQASGEKGVLFDFDMLSERE